MEIEQIIELQIKPLYDNNEITKEQFKLLKDKLNELFKLELKKYYRQTHGELYLELGKNIKDNMFRGFILNHKTFSLNNAKEMQKFENILIHMDKAVRMVRSYDSYEELPKHIKPFIIQNHPAWMAYREAAHDIIFKDALSNQVYNQRKANSIKIEPSNVIDTYENFTKDSLLSVGIEENYSKIKNKKAKVTGEVFTEMNPLSEKKVHSDFINFMFFNDFSKAQDNIVKNNDKKIKITFKTEDSFPNFKTKKGLLDIRTDEGCTNFLKTLQEKGTLKLFDGLTILENEEKNKILIMKNCKTK